jgi:hypothetical protein
MIRWLEARDADTGLSQYSPSELIEFHSIQVAK